jgi:hypothetical protein
MGQLVDGLQEGLQTYLTATFVDRGPRESLIAIAKIVDRRSRESMNPQHDNRMGQKIGSSGIDVGNYTGMSRAFSL